MTAFLDYARRGRNAWWAYLLAVALASALTIGLGVALAFGLDRAGLLPPDLAAQIQSPRDPPVFFGAVAVIFGLILFSCWAAARIVQAKRFGDVVGRWSWSDFARGVLIWVAVLSVLTLVDFLLAPGGFRVTVGPGTLPLAAAALAGLAVQTFAEEWIFRGWLTQGLLLATRNTVATAILSGLLFGSLHIPNGWPQALGATVFGVATAMVAIRLGGIAFTYGVHLVNNLFGAVVVVSGQDVFRGAPGLFTQDTPHLMWWDVAAGALVLAALARFAPRLAPRPAEPGVDQAF